MPIIKREDGTAVKVAGVCMECTRLRASLAAAEAERKQIIQKFSAMGELVRELEARAEKLETSLKHRMMRTWTCVRCGGGWLCDPKPGVTDPMKPSLPCPWCGLTAAIARAVKAEGERDEWREVAQRWTPGGSEFTEPHEVAAHYARRFKEHHEGMKALVRRRREVEAERDAALRKLAELRDEINELDSYAGSCGMPRLIGGIRQLAAVAAKGGA